MESVRVKDLFNKYLDYFLAQCNRHREDLLADNVNKLTVLNKEITTKEIVYTEDITLTVVKLFRHALINQE